MGVGEGLRGFGWTAARCGAQPVRAGWGGEGGWSLGAGAAGAKLRALCAGLWNFAFEPPRLAFGASELCDQGSKPCAQASEPCPQGEKLRTPRLFGLRSRL